MAGQSERQTLSLWNPRAGLTTREVFKWRATKLTWGERNGRYLTSLICCQIGAMRSEIGLLSERRDLNVSGWKRLGGLQRGGGLLVGEKEIEPLRCHLVI